MFENKIKFNLAKRKNAFAITVKPRFSPPPSIKPPLEKAPMSKLIVYNKHPVLE